MKKQILNEKKGITLIALVITIIVLLILAGVAISMLSGENGILTRASEAKERTEEAQNEEETALKDMEIISDFAVKGTPYNFKNGCLTGIMVGVDKDNGYTYIKESAKEVEDKLPEGYSIYNNDGSDIEDKEKNIATGMIIKKNEKVIGGIVIFGELTADGSITAVDRTFLYQFMVWGENRSEINELGVIAADLNADGIINWIDFALFQYYYKENKLEINQNLKATKHKKIETYKTTRENYINEITDNSIKSRFEGLEEVTASSLCTYLIENTDTVGNILKSLPNKNTIILREEEELNSEDPIQDGDIITLTEEVSGAKLSLGIATISINK